MACVLCAQYCLSQTITYKIDYTTAGLSSSSCNVFATPTTVGSYIHQTSFGNPNFNGNALVLLANTYSTAQTFAEQYGINFPFVKNYRYKLELDDANMQIVTGNGYNFPNLAINVGNTNDGTNTSTACVDPPLVSLDKLNNYAWHCLLPTKTPNATVVFDGWMPTQNYTYLLISNYFPDNTVPATFVAYIRQIYISETPPFQLTPKTVDICSTISQTFTVTPNFAVSNITNYVWNLGGTNNGWLYNNAPAPATITTTNNSITLNVAGTKTPNNIFVTVNYNGTSVNTNQSTPVKDPNSIVTIAGPPFLCSNTPGKIYSTNTALSAAWSTDQTGIVSLSCTNCNSTTLTRLTNGTFTLTAAVSGCKTASKQISPPISITKQQGSCSSGGNYQTWLLKVDQPSYGTNWKWTDYDPNNYKIIYSPNSSSTYVDLYANGGTVLLTYTDACGTVQSVPAGIYKYCPPSFTITPNPSKSYIVVSDKSLNNTNTGKIKAIKITDRMGTVRKTYEYKSAINSVKVTVNDLESGVYTLSIYDGQEWNTQSIMVQ